MLAWLVPTSALLAIPWPFVRSVAAVAVFLGPVFFASLIFAVLIRAEADLAPAYGSNVLGAVVGGVLEYLSLLWGFKLLYVLTVVLYLAALLLLRRSGGGRPSLPALPALPAP